MILAIIAVVPAIILLFTVYKKDRLEPEPPGLLLSLVFLGIISTFLALITETIGGWIVGNLATSALVYHLLENFIVVALSEEGFKFLMLKKRTWKHPAFDCKFDAIVYSVFLSMGFALWENILYSFQYGIGTALLRAFTAVPGHACFGVMMGVMYAMAKGHELDGNSAGAKRYLKLAVIVPTLVHGAYDFLASLGGILSTLLFAVFVIIMFIVAWRLMNKQAREDTYYIDPNKIEWQEENWNRYERR